MEITTLLGLIAGTITTFSFVPQVLRTWKLKETKDLSLSMFLCLAVGILLWIAYGFIKMDFPVMLANGVSFILVIVVIFFKLKYK
jgi:MtN3 and saliva related transmembrane protein